MNEATTSVRHDARLSSMDEELVQVGTMLPADMAAELRASARTNERSVAAEIRKALRAWLDDTANNSDGGHL